MQVNTVSELSKRKRSLEFLRHHYEKIFQKFIQFCCKFSFANSVLAGSFEQAVQLSS